MAPTRHPGKPPGWRHDRPEEDGGSLVQRMLRRVKRWPSARPGSFFDTYFQSMAALQKSQEDLRPATLKSPETPTQIDDTLKASLLAATEGLQWQQKLVDILEASPKTDISAWHSKDVTALLVACGIVDEQSLLREVGFEKRVAMARDLVALIRIFEWTFESMPDDEEAMDITRENNLAQGYPPPSPTPMAPNAREPQRSPSGPRRKRQRIRRDEL